MSEMQPPVAPQPPAVPLKPHRGSTVLVFGILGLVMCMPLGIAAWVMGNNDLREMDRGIMDPEGRGNTSAGRICGIISVALTIVGVVGWIIMVVVFAGMGAAMHGISR